jgi:hypothetical protein
MRDHGIDREQRQYPFITPAVNLNQAKEGAETVIVLPVVLMSAPLDRPVDPVTVIVGLVGKKRLPQCVVVNLLRGRSCPAPPAQRRCSPRA